MTDQTFDPALGTSMPDRRSAARAMSPTPAFWFAMFVASALGTNIGDYWADDLGLGLTTSFVSLAVICGLFIWGDRENGARTEVFYWLAIICLRAVATNVGDFLTHAAGMNYLASAIVIAGATLVLGGFTRPALGGASPLIDLRYWGAMFAGGVFGTIGGDLVAHTIGLFLAAVLLGAVLLAVIRLRNSVAGSAIVGYWCVVLAERAAGTPMGDWLAKGRGLGLGLPVSMILVAAVLLATLARRGSGRTASASGVPPWMTASTLLPAFRLLLLVLSVAGSVFMLRLFAVEHPANPTLVLSYGIGLAVNALYLGVQEFAFLNTSPMARVASLWVAGQRTRAARWMEIKEADLRSRARDAD